MIRDEEFVQNPVVEASDQIVGALQDLQRHPDEYLRWPWPALDYMTGGMAKGDVWYVVAFSGNGKTTFLSSAVNRWLDVGKRVFVLPLETKPKRFRTYLACQRLGIKPGDALSGELRARNDPAIPVLEQELMKQAHRPWCDLLRVKGVPEITLPRFQRACEEAADMGADVLIVDHIDHVAAGDGTNLYAESMKVNKAALQYAGDYGLTMLLASQLNTEAVKGQDHLAKFAPPREQHVKFGSHKREVATGMIGLFRPIRAPLSGESGDDYKAALRQARNGEGEPQKMLMPHTMGVVYMKDRNYGTDGRKTLLAVQNGRVEDRDERNDERRYNL
jgi:KaiC/GvpD/RAD55 family RecA-like ATPase